METTARTEGADSKAPRQRQLSDRLCLAAGFKTGFVGLRLCHACPLLLCFSCLFSVSGDTAARFGLLRARLGLAPVSAHPRLPVGSPPGRGWLPVAARGAADPQWHRPTLAAIAEQPIGQRWGQPCSRKRSLQTLPRSALHLSPPSAGIHSSSPDGPHLQTLPF